MSPSNNDEQATAAMASTTTFEGVATRSRTKEVERKKLEQTTMPSMMTETSNNQQQQVMTTQITSPETSEVDNDIDDADIPESVKAVVQDLNERFEASTQPTFGEPMTGGINLVQLLLEMKQDLAVNRLDLKQDVAGLKDELLNKMAENEVKAEKMLEQIKTDAAEREKRALEWQKRMELEMKMRDEQWHGEMDEYYANRFATIRSELLVDVYKTVGEEGHAVRAEIRGEVDTVRTELRGEVTTAGEQLKEDLRKELTQVVGASVTQVVGASVEQMQLEKETLLETVKLQTAEIIQGELMKIKEGYANLSAQMLQMDQVVDKVSDFANEAMLLRNESKKILKEVQKHVAKNKKMITAGENVVPDDTMKKMVDGWTVIQNEWKALETVCYRKMEAFQDTHGSLEKLTQSVESHQREFIKYSEQMRIDIGSADKFCEEVLPTVFRATELYSEFAQVENTLQTIKQIIQEDDERRRAVMQQCSDYRTQVVGTGQC
jgi:hypothetical protein